MPEVVEGRDSGVHTRLLLGLHEHVGREIRPHDDRARRAIDIGQIHLRDEVALSIGLVTRIAAADGSHDTAAGLVTPRALASPQRPVAAARRLLQLWVGSTAVRRDGAGPMQLVDDLEMGEVDEAVEVHEGAPVLRVVVVAIDRGHAARVLGVCELARSGIGLGIASHSLDWSASALAGTSVLFVAAVGVVGEPATVPGPAGCELALLLPDRSLPSW